MEKNIWNLSCHNARSLSEINESSLKLTGKLYNDLQALIQLLGASCHPSFRETGHSDSDLPYFSAISHRFDLFSFKILCLALSSCPTKMVKFNNCELTTEHIDMLLSSLNSEHFTWLQLD